MNTPIMNKVITRPFQPPKVTLAEAETFCGVTNLRDLRIQHPFALKSVFQDWNDTCTKFEWMVYKGDLERLKQEVQKVLAGPVTAKQVPVYSFLELSKLLNRGTQSIKMLKFHHPELFVLGTPPATAYGRTLYFKEETIARIEKYRQTAPTKLESLEKARKQRWAKDKPVKLPPQTSSSNLDIAVLLIQNGFADAGVWLIKNKE